MSNSAPWQRAVRRLHSFLWFTGVVLAAAMASGQSNHQTLEVTLGKKLDSLRVRLTAIHEETFSQPGGYRAVRVLVRTANGSLARANRTLSCTFDWGPHSYLPGPSTTFLVTLPRGSASAETYVTVPAATNMASSPVVSVAADGNKAEVLWSSIENRRPTWVQNEAPAYLVLVIDRDVQVTTTVQIDGPTGRTVLEENIYQGDKRLAPVDAVFTLLDDGLNRMRAQSLLDAGDVSKCQSWYESTKSRLKQAHIGVEHPMDLVPDWRCYMHWSMMVIPAAELIALHDDAPAKTEAIADWVRLGGVLVVAKDGSEADWQSVFRTAFSGRHSEPYGWRRPDSRITVGELARQWSQFSLRNLGVSAPLDPASYDKVLSSSPRPQRGRPIADPEWHTALRYVPLGGGIVAEVPEAELRENIWTAMWLALQSKSGPPSRHELGAYQLWDHRQYCVSPGVRRAPFFAIGFAITAFLLLLGPINWLLVRYWGSRLYFMISIPAIAAATMFLFVVGMLAYEGVGRRSSERSVTWLDQRTGTAASWSHQSFFSTFALRELSYPRHTFARPIDSTTRRYRQSAFHLEHDDNAEHVTSAELRARRFSLWNVGAITATDRQLVIRSRSPEQLEIRNQLGVPLAAVTIRTHAGNYFVAENLEDGERRSLTLVASSVLALKPARTALRSHLGSRMRLQPKNLLTSRAESEASMFVEFQSAAAVYRSDLPRGSYVAVTPWRPPFVPSGATGTKPTPDASVIIGQW